MDETRRYNIVEQKFLNIINSNIIIANYIKFNPVLKPVINTIPEILMYLSETEKGIELLKRLTIYDYFFRDTSSTQNENINQT
jgi:hypothetical protein